jgi:hypothetical protein
MITAEVIITPETLEVIDKTNFTEDTILKVEMSLPKNISNLTKKQYAEQLVETLGPLIKPARLLLVEKGQIDITTYDVTRSLVAIENRLREIETLLKPMYLIKYDSNGDRI